jgi:hypothetical protein
MQGPSVATTSLRVAPLHRRDGRFDHTRQGPFPAGVRGSDDARALIGKQDHAAIRAGYAKRQAGGGRHQRIALGARARRPKLGYGDRVGRVNLEWHGETLRRRAERSRNPGAVLAHRLRRIPRADAPVQRCVDPLRDPAETREETVRDTGNP